MTRPHNVTRYDGRLSLQLASEHEKAMRQLAELHDTSVSHEIRVALRRYLADDTVKAELAAATASPVDRELPMTG